MLCVRFPQISDVCSGCIEKGCDKMIFHFVTSPILFFVEIFVTVVIRSFDCKLGSKAFGGHLVDPDTWCNLYRTFQGAAVGAVICGSSCLSAGFC